MRTVKLRAAALAASAAVLMAAGAAHAQEELTVIVYGGSFEEGWRKSVIEPFEAANPDIKVRIATGLTMQTVAMMRAQKDDVNIDVIMMDEIGAAQANAEGLYEPLSVEAVPNLEKLYPQFRVEGDPYTKFMYVSQALVYDTDIVTEEPTSWKAMWDEDYVGRIAVPDITTSHGAFFLLTAADMNGGSVENIDPGFALISELKPSILTFWTQHAQLAQLFSQGEVVMSSWTTDRAQAQIDAGAPLAWTIPEESAYIIDSTIGIAKGTKHLEAAQKYINFVLGEEAQAKNAEFTYLAPVNKDVVLEEDVAAKLPVGEGVLDSLKQADWDYVTTVRPEWTHRWTREITSP
ncbi:polyamine ABC transporter substrate-binding protein [Acuticoccus sp. M5D2P5]|uniref:ABC transporter substrate-binding protein n=1 Tax=Acuticoccus kalidii TaxID=2910977 RepID=UPI001F2C1F42|nr:polyamine ABC transporter substrate-binding protein [Acuticoccus kalidii]MCF3935704.1 polyamine ABC transporter substrate-binding protein [Acuticoccus kalidii]